MFSLFVTACFCGLYWYYRENIYVPLLALPEQRAENSDDDPYMSLAELNNILELRQMMDYLQTLWIWCLIQSIQQVAKPKECVMIQKSLKIVEIPSKDSDEKKYDDFEFTSLDRKKSTPQKKEMNWNLLIACVQSNEVLVHGTVLPFYMALYVYRTSTKLNIAMSEALLLSTTE